MDRLIRRARDEICEARDTARNWKQQLLLGAAGTNTQIAASPHPVPCITKASTVSQDQSDTHRICFEAHTLPSTLSSSADEAKHVNILSVKQLGDVNSITTCVKRDLGFAGRIGQYVLLSYGDTLYSDQEDSDKFQGMVSNSIAFATHDPLVVVDPVLEQNGFPCQFVPTIPRWNEDQATHAIGITNVIETSHNEGILFTLLNHRPDGTDNLIGAGVARITVNTSIYPPVPSATRPFPFIWDGECEPWYGDVSAIKANGYVYVYGHKRDNPWVYLARVKTKKVEDIKCYEYWHGNSTGWTSKRLIGDQIGEEQSVFWQINQGQVFWSVYFDRYLFVYCDNFWSSTVLMKYASAPEGPWSDAITIYKAIPVTATGNIYAAVPHPYFDASGKTLVITFTNHPNCIQAIKVVFG